MEEHQGIDGNTHRQSIFVEAIADIRPEVARIRALVYDALSVVDVAIVGLVPREDRVLGVLKVNEDKASLETAVTGLRTNGHSIVEL